MISSHTILTPGDQAPFFSMLSDDEINISLTSLEGENFVLYFYPRNDTPGCTLEAKDFKDRIEAFKEANTRVIGVSKDDTASHKAFKEKYCLPFTLASDLTGEVVSAYGVWVEKQKEGKSYMGIERTTFLIDNHGVIAHIWRDVNVTGHADDVLKKAQNLSS